jgi:hypothetical protein
MGSAVGDCQFVIRLTIGIAIPPTTASAVKANAARYRVKKHSRGNVLFGQHETDASETFA